MLSVNDNKLSCFKLNKNSFFYAYNFFFPFLFLLFCPPNSHLSWIHQCKWQFRKLQQRNASQSKALFSATGIKQLKMLCIQVTNDMISPWDCPITEMNDGSLPENTYWSLAVNFTMFNAEVTILQMCVNWSCCCLFLAGWFVAKDKTKQEKCLHPGQAGHSPANFPSWIIWSSLLRSQFIAREGQIDCLHLTKMEGPWYSLKSFAELDSLKNHPIFPGQATI